MTTLPTSEFTYVLLLFAILVAPKVLQRYGFPAAITSFLMGVVAALGFGLFLSDPTVRTLGILGIVALFLFAGLEINFQDLRHHVRILGQHLIIGLSTLALSTALLHWLLPLSGRQATLTALAILTPSTGFILDSIRQFTISDDEKFWVRNKAIATELVAFGTLFFVLQTSAWSNFTFSLSVLALLILALPFAFKLIARRILPYAPRSEFAFLLMVAVMAAAITKLLGVYYLIGAFVVGITAQRFRQELSDFSSEKMLDGIEMFASFFVPFYFFNAGLHLQATDLSWKALAAGLLLTIVFLPVRVALVMLHRLFAYHEPLSSSYRIGVSMLPTLVFGLVIAGILRDQFNAPGWLYGGLTIYTLISTALPIFALNLPPINLEALRASEITIKFPDPPSDQP